MFGKKQDIIQLDEETRQKVIEMVRKQQEDNLAMMEEGLKKLSEDTQAKVKVYVKEEVDRQLRKRGL